MSSKDLKRLYKFSDARLVVKTREKIAFMRRDAAKFEAFGIGAEKIALLENGINAFAELSSDTEALYEKVSFTQVRNDKAEELRVALRRVLLSAQMAFGQKSAQYKSFVTGALSRKKGNNLVLAGKVIIEKGTFFAAKLAEYGVSPAILSHINTLCNELDNLVIEQQIKVSDRSLLYEKRVVMGNELYAVLINYTAVGLLVWETESPAKYNDYIIYKSLRKKRPVNQIDEPVTEVE